MSSEFPRTPQHKIYKRKLKIMLQKPVEAYCIDRILNEER